MRNVVVWHLMTLELSSVTCAGGVKSAIIKRYEIEGVVVVPHHNTNDALKT